MTPRLATHIWVAAHIRRAEIAGAAAYVARRGDAESGAVYVKLVDASAPFSAPRARALSRAVLGDGASGWSWLVGPEPAPEAEVDGRLARAAEFDPDIWVLEIEDREGRHFLDDPIG